MDTLHPAGQPAEPHCAPREGDGAAIPWMRVIRQIMLQLTGRAGSLVLMAGILAATTRYLRPPEFGVYATIVAGAAIAGAICDLGLESTVTRDAIREPADVEILIGSVLALGRRSAWLCYGLVVAAVVAAHALGLRFNDWPALCIGLLTVPALPFRLASNVLGRIRLQTAIPTVCDLGARSMGLALMVLLDVGAPVPTFRASQLTIALAAIGIPAILGSSAGWLLLSRRLGFSPSRRPGVGGKLLLRSTPLAAIIAIGVAHYRVDVLLVALLAGSRSVAFYSVAARYVDVALGFGAAAGALVFPQLVRMTDLAYTAMRRSFQDSLEAMLAFGLVFALPALVTPALVVGIAAGAGYHPSALSLRILALGLPAMFVNVLLSYMVVNLRLWRPALAIVCLDLAANIALNLVLIPPYLQAGAALSTDITEAINALAVGLLVFRALGARPAALRPLLLIAGAGIAYALGLLTMSTLGGPAALVLASGLFIAWSVGILLHPRHRTAGDEPREAAKVPRTVTA